MASQSSEAKLEQERQSQNQDKSILLCSSSLRNPQELFQAVPTDVGICCAFNFNSTMKETVYARWCEEDQTKKQQIQNFSSLNQVDCRVEAEGEQGGEVEGARGEEGQSWLRYGAQGVSITST